MWYKFFCVGIERNHIMHSYGARDAMLIYQIIDELEIVATDYLRRSGILLTNGNQFYKHYSHRHMHSTVYPKRCGETSKHMST